MMDFDNRDCATRKVGDIIEEIMNDMKKYNIYSIHNNSFTGDIERDICYSSDDLNDVITDWDKCNFTDVFIDEHNHIVKVYQETYIVDPTGEEDIYGPDAKKYLHTNWTLLILDVPIREVEGVEIDGDKVKYYGLELEKKNINR